MRLTNQEKSARRYEIMNNIAQVFAETNPEFKTFCWSEKEEEFDITWRKWETYLKQKFESGAQIRTVIESSASGG